MRLGENLDMRCANLGVSYEVYLNKKHKEGWKDSSDHGHSQQDLQAMLERARQKNER